MAARGNEAVISDSTAKNQAAEDKDSASKDSGVHSSSAPKVKTVRLTAYAAILDWSSRAILIMLSGEFGVG